VQDVDSLNNGERWIFANVQYPASIQRGSFVISVGDVSDPSGLQITNSIFNAPLGVVNVAATVSGTPSTEQMAERIRSVAATAFRSAGIETAIVIEAVVERPVMIQSQTVNVFSRGNLGVIGDNAGNFSPLAGLGGTLAMTAVPYAVERFASEFRASPDLARSHFNQNTAAYVRRWKEKAERVRGFLQGAYEAQHGDRRSESKHPEIGQVFPELSSLESSYLFEIQRDLLRGATPAGFLTTLPAVFLVFLMQVGIKEVP
jgi:hypothetical protein